MAIFPEDMNTARGALLVTEKSFVCGTFWNRSCGLYVKLRNLLPPANLPHFSFIGLNVKSKQFTIMKTVKEINFELVTVSVCGV